jgi:hypothetical protein
MKKVFLALTAIPALIAVPAAAQYANSNVNTRASSGISNRIVQLETRLDAGIRQGEIDRDEARALRQQLRQLRRTERMYSRDGIDQQERADLRTQLRAVRQDIRTADRGTYDRYEQQYGNYDDDDRNDRYGDNRTDRYGDNRDDRRDGYYGQGGPVEADGWVVDETGGRTAGVPGLIGSLFGVGGVQVGQRVSGNLYAVPYEYRNQFRDNSNVYYRSDGNRIIEVDARTHTVLRIYDRETD